MYLSKHFHLAFQGGGAKGLAYVGAYRSINEQRCVNYYERKNQGLSELKSELTTEFSVMKEK
jgi:predicted acylesterase/phospholipase RssA